MQPLLLHHHAGACNCTISYKAFTYCKDLHQQGGAAESSIPASIFQASDDSKPLLRHHFTKQLAGGTGSWPGRGSGICYHFPCRPQASTEHYSKQSEGRTGKSSSSSSIPPLLLVEVSNERKSYDCNTPFSDLYFIWIIPSMVPHVDVQ